jgi:hypothetical protein
MSVSCIMLMHFLPPSTLAKVLAKAWGGKRLDSGDDES